MTIRPARPDDKSAIATFTTDTFEWGDYVADAFDAWMEDPDGQILIAATDEDEELIRWLNDHDYTHLLVHWGEMSRLRKTYGFWKALTPELFERLQNTGLAATHHFRDPRGQIYATLYEVRMMPKSQLRNED